MRLIDADKLIEKLRDFKEWENDDGRPIHTMSEIQRIDRCINFAQTEPTAFDADKVVSELEKTMQDLSVIEVFSHIDFDSTIQSSLDEFLKAYNSELLRIIKQGGVSDDVCEWNGYKVAEEQDLMFRLPCGIGDDVYFIPSKTNYKLNILQGHPEINRVYHQNVERITYTPTGWYLECDKDLEYATDNILVDKLYKETWFLTQEEAEQKLKEMESD